MRISSPPSNSPEGFAPYVLFYQRTHLIPASLAVQPGALPFTILPTSNDSGAQDDIEWAACCAEDGDMDDIAEFFYEILDENFSYKHMINTPATVHTIKMESNDEFLEIARFDLSGELRQKTSIEQAECRMQAVYRFDTVPSKKLENSITKLWKPADMWNREEIELMPTFPFTMNFKQAELLSHVNESNRNSFYFSYQTKFQAQQLEKKQTLLADQFTHLQLLNYSNKELLLTMEEWQPSGAEEKKSKSSTKRNMHATCDVMDPNLLQAATSRFGPVPVRTTTSLRETEERAHAQKRFGPIVEEIGQQTPVHSTIRSEMTLSSKHTTGKRLLFN
jgi:hypothetical protein